MAVTKDAVESSKIPAPPGGPNVPIGPNTGGIAAAPLVPEGGPQAETQPDSPKGKLKGPKNPVAPPAAPADAPPGPVARLWFRIVKMPVEKNGATKPVKVNGVQVNWLVGRELDSFGYPARVIAEAKHQGVVLEEFER